MKNPTVLVQNSGLDNKQAAVYMASLELGEALISDISRKALVKRSTTYLAVDVLVTLGLLSVKTVGKRKLYSAVHPRRLLGLARFREKEIESAMPELVALYNTPKEKPKIQVFEGMEGVRSLYRELYASLSSKEEALWIARIGALREFAPEGLAEYKKVLRSLVNPKIRELNYGDEEGIKWSKEIKRLQGKNHHIRLLPTDFEFGFSDNLIFGNKLAIFSLKKSVFVMVIESADVVKTYKALFEWAWKSAATL